MKEKVLDIKISRILLFKVKGNSLFGEIIGRIAAPLVFFIIFVSLIVPIGFFYRIFIFKSQGDWVNSSEGNDDDFKNEF